MRYCGLSTIDGADSQGCGTCKATGCASGYVSSCADRTNSTGSLIGSESKDGITCGTGCSYTCKTGYVTSASCGTNGKFVTELQDADASGCGICKTTKCASGYASSCSSGYKLTDTSTDNGVTCGTCVEDSCSAGYAKVASDCSKGVTGGYIYRSDGLYIYTNYVSSYTLVGSGTCKKCKPVCQSGYSLGGIKMPNWTYIGCKASSCGQGMGFTINDCGNYILNTTGSSAGSGLYYSGSKRLGYVSTSGGNSFMCSICEADCGKATWGGTSCSSYQSSCLSAGYEHTGSCPANGNCTSCYENGTTYYKLNSCNTGYAVYGTYDYCVKTYTASEIDSIL